MELQLRHGVARFDEQDAALIAAFSWSSVAPGERRRYAVTKILGHTVYMHQLVWHGIPTTRRRRRREIDHINGDGLDNRRENLRLATRSQNNINRQATGGRSRYKGVSWSAERQVWQAHIRVDRRSRALGVYETEEDAARAYDLVARRKYGDFAVLNFPDRLAEPPPTRYSAKGKGRDLEPPSVSTATKDGRQGAGNGRAKLTEDQARAIIEQLRIVPRRSQKSIAEEFGVQQTTISRILRRQAWGHLWN